MRINAFVARASGLSRRAADTAIHAGRVRVNGSPAAVGHAVQPADRVTLDGRILAEPYAVQTVLLHKPTGYVVSRSGQGSKTIYDLLPSTLHHLKPVGRLDKDSSGLLLLTNNGQLAHQLTHPSSQKSKVYEVRLDQPLTPAHRRAITGSGVQLADGTSRLQLDPMPPGTNTAWRVTMHEGRNRQIRRTFAALGYTVTTLHRIQFGPYILDPRRLPPGAHAPTDV